MGARDELARDESIDPRPFRVVGRAVVGLAVSGLAVLWALVATFLVLVRCDDSCGSVDGVSWEWIGQFALMVLGVFATFRAVHLAFVNRDYPNDKSHAVFGYTALVSVTLWLFWLPYLG